MLLCFIRKSEKTEVFVFFRMCTCVVRLSLSSSSVTVPRPLFYDSVFFRGKLHSETRTSPAQLSFVLKVPLCNLHPSVINSVPCDRC